MTKTTLEQVVNICWAVGAIGLTIMAMVLGGIILSYLILETREMFRR